MKNFIFFLPEFFLLIILLFLCLIVPFFNNKLIYKYTNIINFLEVFLVINLFILILININSFEFIEHNIFNFIFLNNSFTLLLKVFLILFSIFILIIIKDHINFDFKNKCDFFIIFIFLLFSLICLIMCVDLVYAAMLIQLQNLSFYILLSSNSNKNKYIEGSLKYFFLSSVSFGFYLFAVSIIYNIFGSTKMNELYYLILLNNTDNYNILLVSFIFIIISIFFKLSVAPFHFWAPDVYTSMNRSVLLVFSILPKISLIFFFYKIYFYILKNFFFFWDGFFFIFIILSFLIGFFGAVNSKNIQNLFSYLWIYTVNFFLIFFFLDVNIYIYIFILVYSINILSFCICLLYFKQKSNNIYKKEIILLKQLTFVNKSNPLLFFCFYVSILSLLGLPPLSGFLSKFFLLITLVEENYIFFVFFILFFSIISCFYYLRLIKISSFDNTNKWFFLIDLNKSNCFILSFFIFFSLFSFFFFPFLLELLKFIYLSSLYFF